MAASSLNIKHLLLSLPPASRMRDGLFWRSELQSDMFKEELNVEIILENIFNKKWMFKKKILNSNIAG